MLDVHLTPESSHVEKARYNHGEETLTIYLKNGKIFSYKKVPSSVWNEYRQSESTGEFISRSIKAKYKAEEVIYG